METSLVSSGSGSELVADPTAIVNKPHYIECRAKTGLVQVCAPSGRIFALKRPGGE